MQGKKQRMNITQLHTHTAGSFEPKIDTDTQFPLHVSSYIWPASTKIIWGRLIKAGGQCSETLSDKNSPTNLWGQAFTIKNPLIPTDTSGVRASSPLATLRLLFWSAWKAMRKYISNPSRPNLQNAFWGKPNLDSVYPDYPPLLPLCPAPSGLSSIRTGTPNI